MNIIELFEQSGSDEFDKFILEHLKENSLQYTEQLLKYSLDQKNTLPLYSPDYMVYWSIQISCEQHLVLSGLYERIHDISQSKSEVRKKDERNIH